MSALALRLRELWRGLESGSRQYRACARKVVGDTIFPSPHEIRMTMIRIEQLLCPVDFSEIAQHALDHAVAIARWYEARLTVLYVFANLLSMDFHRGARARRS